MKLLDLCCGAGGAAKGYHLVGIDDITGIDVVEQPHYPFSFIKGDALEYLAEHGGEYDMIHASPPCQGYSVMNNLPWLKGRTYPLLILPLIEALEALGKPYVLENVMGARYGAKGLQKRGLEAHGLQAGWLCGQMFGLPFYRHRLFATNWFWLAPGHPKHQLNLHPRSERYVYGGTVKGLPGGVAGLDVKPRTNAQQKALAIEITTPGGTTEPGYELTQWQENDLRDLGNGHSRLKDKRISNYVLDGDVREKGFEAWRKGSQAAQASLMAKTKGWRLAAEMMGIDWMNRAELTQAIPPVYAFWLGAQLFHLMDGK